ncbi:MAG: LuxR C-terminal-related transcriptional regulator [Gammaproteobacteria bacterium]
MSTLTKHSTQIKKFYLGKKYSDQYFTQQEANCMYYFLKGYSNQAIAEALALSVRTIIFYSGLMRRKVPSHSNKELIEQVKESNFIHYLEEIEQALS